MKLLLSYDSKVIGRLSLLKEFLTSLGHTIYDFDKLINYNLDQINKDELKHIYQQYIIQRRNMISEVDAILILNFKDSNGKTDISVDEILDMYEAFQQNKPIFVYNNINNKKDFEKFDPIYINSDIKKIVDPFIELYPILEYLNKNGEQLLDNLASNIGMDKQQYDRLIRKAELNKWVLIDRWECFETIELSEEGKRKVNPYYKQYRLKLGGIR